MELLFQPEVQDYCGSTFEERASWIGQRLVVHGRPSSVLPLFEICRVIHYGSKNDSSLPAKFRACWNDLTDELYSYSTDGYLCHTTQTWDDDWKTVVDLQRMGLASEIDVSDIQGDPRCLSVLELDLTRRFRALAKLAFDNVRMWPETSRGWRCNPPEKMERCEYVLRPDSDQSVIMDTCHVLDVLPCLNPDGLVCDDVQFPARLTRPAIQYYERMLSLRGLTGSLVIPACVVEQAGRKAIEDVHSHGQSGAILRAIAMNPDHPVWSVFRFDPLTQDVLNAFLNIHESIFEAGFAFESLPHFSDALILAHGLACGHPVASNEWHEKDEWNGVGSLFPFLKPRWTSPSS